MFFSVWKRQRDGSFKVVLDIGSDTPSAVVPIDEPPHSSWRAGQGQAARSRRRGGECRTARRGRSVSRGRDGGKPRARIRRPARGRGARPSAGQHAGRRPRRAQRMGERTDRPISRRGAVRRCRTIGRARLHLGQLRAGSARRREAGYFARVWKKVEGNEWRIVMDTVSPVPAGVKPLTAELMRAEEPYLEGRWAEAEAAYRQYVEANPSNAFAWNRLGTSQVQQKKYSDAVRSLERAIEIGGGAPADFYNLACAYALAGNAGEVARQRRTGDRRGREAPRPVRIRPGPRVAARAAALQGIDGDRCSASRIECRRMRWSSSCRRRSWTPSAGARARPSSGVQVMRCTLVTVADALQDHRGALQAALDVERAALVVDPGLVPDLARGVVEVEARPGIAGAASCTPRASRSRRRRA